jgi:hypothetical protein
MLNVIAHIIGKQYQFVRRLTTDSSLCGDMSNPADDDDQDIARSRAEQIKSTILSNVFIFVVFLIFFELNRHIRSIYLQRVVDKFRDSKRVPPVPPSYPLGWLVSTLKVDDEDLIKMIGLDGYVLVRYLKLCIRMTSFMFFWGLIVLVPIYNDGTCDKQYWNKFTISNLRNESDLLWAPVFFAYLYAAYFCYELDAEYINFVNKRTEYLINGDSDTPMQTYYTVMITNLPQELQSAPQLTAFFEKLFPNQVYHVEIALQTDEIDKLSVARVQVRNDLEKAIAIWKATDIRPKILLKLSTVLSKAYTIEPLETNSTLIYCGYRYYDKIDFLNLDLDTLNEKVAVLQLDFHEQSKKIDEITDLQTNQGFVGTQTTAAFDKLTGVLGNFNGSHEKIESLDGNDDENSGDGVNLIMSTTKEEKKNIDNKETDKNTTSKILNVGIDIGSHLQHGVEDIAKVGFKNVGFVTKGALKTVFNATRALELITIGSFYKASTTAFVTFNSRVAGSTAYQMLLSQTHFKMEVNLAPNPHDVIWSNIALPEDQITFRSYISNAISIFGILFWTTIVGFIATISNLQTLQEYKGWEWLKDYNNSWIFKFLSTYLSLILLLVLLSLLPVIFDALLRNYEGRKLEGDIQKEVMSRYFYYQLVNVFISVISGTILTSVTRILDDPGSALVTLGFSFATFSTYFTNLLIVKCFTAVPVQMLRIWPLIQVTFVRLFSNKKKTTRRELKSGAYADYPIDYGETYPSILMVLIIVMTYGCISPFLVTFAMIFFVFAYISFKYQLLYVFINEFQTGGFMWYSVFNRSIISLLCGVFTLIAYMGVTNYSAMVFYFLWPLPVLIYGFWKRCNSIYKVSSLNLSLENSIDLDEDIKIKKENNESIPLDKFKKKMFRQPNLAVGPLKPAAYRKATSPSDHRNPESLSFVGESFIDTEQGSEIGDIGEDMITSDATSIARDSDIDDFLSPPKNN